MEPVADPPPGASASPPSSMSLAPQADAHRHNARTASTREKPWGILNSNIPVTVNVRPGAWCGIGCAPAELAMLALTAANSGCEAKSLSRRCM